MNTLSLSCKLVVFFGCAFLASSASAQFIGVSGSTAVPPTVFGGFTMTPFGTDGRPVYNNVNDVTSPLGGLVAFSSALTHLQIGSGWLTWSNGYTGDVYFFSGSSSLTLTLPASTSAFYFYTEPNDLGNHTFTVTSGSTVLSDIVNGNGGAEFFGFYTTDSSPISSITLSSNDLSGFALGEFGIGRASPVPEPSTYALSGAAALFGLVMVRRLRRKAA